MISFSMTSAAAANYDEAKVPAYTLPDPLILEDGQEVADPETWFQKRRPEILKLFEREVYGKSPGRPEKMRFELTSSDPDALEGKAPPALPKSEWLNTPGGRPMTWSSLKGKVVLLDFWAHW